MSTKQASCPRGGYLVLAVVRARGDLSFLARKAARSGDGRGWADRIAAAKSYVDEQKANLDTHFSECAACADMSDAS